MKVFTASFNGVWLGPDAVVVATDAEEAQQAIAAELTQRGLDTRVASVHLTEVKSRCAQVIILNDGDY